VAVVRMRTMTSEATKFRNMVESLLSPKVGYR
jgi:hypothetical protein